MPVGDRIPLTQTQADGLSKARGRANYHQHEAADVLNISPTTLSNWEQHAVETLPKISLLILLGLYWYSADDTDEIEAIYDNHDLLDRFETAYH